MLILDVLEEGWFDQPKYSAIKNICWLHVASVLALKIFTSHDNKPIRLTQRAPEGLVSKIASWILDFLLNTYNWR